LTNPLIAKPSDPTRWLIIPDLHLPYARKEALEFCKQLYKEWECDAVLFLGDIVEWNSISFHEGDPGMPGAMDEYEATKAAVKDWHDAFPGAIITIGNHDERIFRMARSAGIPDVFIRDYNSVWNTPTWTWKDHHIIKTASADLSNIYCYHGTGQGGKYPAANAVTKLLMSVIMGHNHTAFGLKYFTNPSNRIFGMDCGALIDDKALAFAYAKHTKQRSTLGAAVIIDGVPYLEILPISKGERHAKN
jgi:predicted phosphodiesterase